MNFERAPVVDVVPFTQAVRTNTFTSRQAAANLTFDPAIPIDPPTFLPEFRSYDDDIRLLSRRFRSGRTATVEGPPTGTRASSHGKARMQRPFLQGSADDLLVLLDDPGDPPL